MDNITPTPEQVTQVAAILRTENVTEAGGEWSAFSVATMLDPDAHKPRGMFDTGGPYPSAKWCAIARAAIDRLNPPARYVGGTSNYLYHLSPLPLTAWDAEADPCPHGNAIGTRCGTCDGPAGAADHQPRETDR